MNATSSPSYLLDGHSPLATVIDRAIGAARSLGALQLTPENVLRTAESLTGLHDRNQPEIMAPLQAICDDFAEVPPTDLGAAIVHATLVQGMVSRRRLQRVFDSSPTRTVYPPIVLVGWYRTGTTYLQQLLAALPHYGFVPMYRLAEPVPSLQGGGYDPAPLRWVSEWLSRARFELGTASMSMLAPELNVLHKVTATGAEECWLLTIAHLISEGVAFHWKVPRYDRWLLDVDRQPVYRTWARAAAYLERELGHGLVLKDPAHMRALPELVRAMPNAKLVWTHRDPAKSIASFCGLSASQRRLVYGGYDGAELGENALTRAERYFRSGLEARENLPSSQIIDVKQDEIRRAPVACVERICDHFGLPFDAVRIEARVRELAESEGGAHSSLDTWGLTPTQVHSRLSFYDASWWRR
jgi:hypothetical protein